MRVYPLIDHVPNTTFTLTDLRFNSADSEVLLSYNLAKGLRLKIPNVFRYLLGSRRREECVRILYIDAVFYEIGENGMFLTAFEE